MFKPLLKESELQNLNWDKYQEMSGMLTRINRTDLESEMELLPTTYSYYAGLAEKAKAKVHSAEQLLEECKSQIKKELRDSGQKVTVAQGEDFVNCDEDIKRLTITVMECNEIYRLMKCLCDALHAKKEMLVQLSANQRQETKLYSN